jgi:hypothetical protein
VAGGKKMKNIKMSLIDNDYAVQCKAELQLNEAEKRVLSRFLQEINEELSIGQAACLEIEGEGVGPISVSVSNFQ